MITNTITIFLTAALAVQAAPHFRRQAVTSLISSYGPPPPGCKTDSTSLFGIGIHRASGAVTGVTQASDAQPGAPTGVSQTTDGQPQVPTGVISQTTDGQVQAPTGVVSQTTDGQVQAPTGVVHQTSDGQPQVPTSTMTMMPISQIHDGQAQAYYSQPAITQIGDGQVQAPTVTGVNQITDGQVQAPTGTGVSQITDGQIQAPTKTGGVSQTSDGQAQAPTGVSQGPDGQASSGVHMVACKNNSTLELTIEGGLLYDGQRRRGYIAANYQFQFDAVAPQAGALITAGFSLCANGSLALGGNTIFWQCLSGTFYNLYDRDWAAQCEPVYLTALDLVQCP